MLFPNIQRGPHLNADGVCDLLVNSLLVVRLGERTALELTAELAHGSSLFLSNTGTSMA